MISTRSLLLGALALKANALPPLHHRQSPISTASDLDNLFLAAVNSKRVPGIGAIALDRDGTVLYNSSFGTVNINDPLSAPITSSTKMQIASMTKQVVAVAALQLIEQDKLSLEDLVEDYLPSWKNISVLQGFDSVCGEPILRQPKTKATILNLFTHTSGLAYWFLTDSINTWRLWSEKQQVKPDEPLAADPGTGYFYGESIDTLGYVIEAISGQGLDEYIQANIFRPLGIKNSGLITPDIWTHYRYPNGTIVLTSPPTPIGPEGVAFGGGYLISTLDDYSTFLLTLLNWGTHPLSGVTLLKSSTVRRIVFADLIPKAITVPDSERTGEPVGAWKSNNQSYSLSLDFLPGIKKGWSGSLLINLEDVEGRRRKGSGAWAGIFNTFYWVDLWSGKLGVIFTNLMPFLDGEVLGLFDRLEEFVYSG